MVVSIRCRFVLVALIGLLRVMSGVDPMSVLDLTLVAGLSSPESEALLVLLVPPFLTTPLLAGAVSPVGVDPGPVPTFRFAFRDDFSSPCFPFGMRVPLVAERPPGR
jgi:hypothetical protein